MPNSIADKIESHFAKHQDSGEFARLPREAPYKFIGATSSPAILVYATKQALLSEPVVSGLPNNVAVIQRYGLPAAEDVPWIRSLAGDLPLGFVGDLDPVDLFVFAWLQTQLTGAAIQYLGVGDRLLGEMRQTERARAEIRLHPSEIAAIPLLEEALPELGQLIGRHGNSMLLDGRKMELEGVILGHDWKADRFWQTLLDPTPNPAS